MHSPFTYNPNAHRATSHYQQQSVHFNQPVYNIGAPTMNAGFMNHQYVNHAPFTRSFASVVGCENNDLAKHQHMPNNVIESSPSFLGSIFKHFNNKQTPKYPHTPPPTAHRSKEFEDFTHMPMVTVNNLHNYNLHHPQLQQQHYYQQPQNVHINQFYCAPPSANNNNNMSTSTRNFMATFFGRCQQQPAPSKPKYSRWFNRGFRSRGGRGRHNHNQKFQDHDVNFPKNAHEKERSSIERDINDDSCDFVHIIEDKDVIRSSANVDKASPNNPNETASGSCGTTPADTPPFMIYSLEEFPAIVTTSGCVPVIEIRSPTASPPAKLEKPEEGFVVVPSSASSSTPSFTPKRISLCEKIIKSPTKLFPKPIPMALKPCLKAPRRNVSECSDDFIVFANNSSEFEPQEISFSESEDDSDSEDDDDIVFEGEEMTDIIEEDGVDSADESDDESDDDDNEIPEHQLDSGLEEKRVSCTR